MGPSGLPLSLTGCLPGKRASSTATGHQPSEHTVVSLLVPPSTWSTKAQWAVTGKSCKHRPVPQSVIREQGVQAPVPNYATKLAVWPDGSWPFTVTAVLMKPCPRSGHHFSPLGCECLDQMTTQVSSWPDT